MEACQGHAPWPPGGLWDSPCVGWGLVHPSSRCGLPSRAPVREAAPQPGFAHAVGQCSHLPQEQQRWENKGLKLAVILICRCRHGMASPAAVPGLVQLVFGSSSSSFLRCMVLALQWEAARFLLCHPGQAASDPSQLGARDLLLAMAGPPCLPAPVGSALPHLLGLSPWSSTGHCRVHHVMLILASAAMYTGNRLFVSCQ